MKIAYYDSPLGRITIAGENDTLLGLWFEKQKYYLGKYACESLTCEDVPVFQEARHWLNIYFSGHEPIFTPRLSYGSTEFAKLVCDIMLEIPYGKTMTYAMIAAEAAKRMGRTRMSAQAVGGAVGHNPISLIIPCHRVVGSNGNLTGYAAGIERKLRLLQLEGVDTAGFTMPK